MDNIFTSDERVHLLDAIDFRMMNGEPDAYERRDLMSAAIKLYPSDDGLTHNAGRLSDYRRELAKANDDIDELND